MPSLLAIFASSAVVLVAACGSKSPKPVDPRDVEGPGDLGGKNVTPPGIPGVAYINLHCEPAKVDCNGQPFDMQLVGDRLDSCRITPNAAAPGTSNVSIQLKNRTDPTQNILVSFDGYTGTGRYPLDHVNDRHVSLAQGLSLPSWGPENATCTNGSWSGPETSGTHIVGAPDPSCGANQCQVQIVERDPTASPRKLEVNVQCDTMCMNNDDVVCHAGGGNSYIDFSFNVDNCTN